MKFSSKFLCLFSVVSTLAQKISLNTINNKYVIKSITYDENADCITSINEYKECYSDKNSIVKNLDGMCDIFLSDKCQKFYKNGIEKLNGCDKLSGNVLFANTIKYEAYDILFSELCSKDESSNYCPMSVELQSELKGITINNKGINSIISKTCKSEKCTVDAIEFISREIELENKLKELEDKMSSSPIKRQLNANVNVKASSEEEIEELKSILEYLNSDHCNSHVSGNLKSGATTNTIKYSNIILISIGLFLYTLI